MQAQKSFILNLKVVTPMFLGGPEKQAELRPQSIKGALRFWFRATHQNYREKEKRLFGSEEHGIGCFSVTIKCKNLHPNEKLQLRDNDPLRYLAYGTENRKAIPEGSTFSVDLCFRPWVEAEETDSINKAIWAWLVFGGLGARSRRGFGSLSVCPPPGGHQFQFNVDIRFPSKTGLSKSITRFINDIDTQSDLPSHSCFSGQSRCLVGPEKDNAEDALRSIAENLRDYRSFEKRKLLSDPNQRDLFLKDHDNLRNYLKNGTLPPTPDRIAFGLPHNYYFKSLVGWLEKRKFNDQVLAKLVSYNVLEEMKEDTNFVRFGKQYRALANGALEHKLEEIGLSPPQQDEVVCLWKFAIKSFPRAQINLFRGNEEMRRASPLFIHIQELQNGKACAVVTLLKARLLPENGNVKISSKSHGKSPISGSADFKAIDGFLDDLKSNGNYEEISIQKA